jgi:uncharacterized cupredoxin-like copper-binding protein
MRRITFLSVLALTGLLLAACGGAAAPTPTPKTVDFNFSNNLVFEPKTFSAETGAQVTLNLNNANAGLEHSFVLVPAGTDLTQSDDAINAQAIGGVNSGKVAPGATQTYTFVAPNPGTYTYVCTVPGHAAAGMVGELTVTALPAN